MIIKFLKENHILHTWDRWNDTGKGKITIGNYKYGYYIRQERRCKVCGKVEQNDVEVYRR